MSVRVMDRQCGELDGWMDKCIERLMYGCLNGGRRTEHVWMGDGWRVA